MPAVMSHRPERPAIILDCDPGHDDAVAIVVAAHCCEVLGITTVAGNAPLDRTTHNALVMRELAGLDTQVHAGAERPLVAPPMHASYVHGESGLDGADLPAPTRPLDGTDAVEFIIDTCRRQEGVWLVPVGPLTNIGLALRAAPDLAGRIAGISVMGGGSVGNRTAVAEFNIWADPEAAAVVVGASEEHGTRLLLAGLDVTHRFQATPSRVEEVRALPGRLAAVLADLFDFFSAGYVARHEDFLGAAVHDPLAVLAVTHPELFTVERRHVGIELRGELTRGMTVIDRRTLVDRPAANCEVVTDVDADAAWRLVVDAVAAASTAPSTS
jgi:inosine-uridine nucleoside N-ribohydrolase